MSGVEASDNQESQDLSRGSFKLLSVFDASGSSALQAPADKEF